MSSRDWEGAPLQDYPDRSIWTTWALSYNAIRERDVPAANLLLLWAFLDNKDLWYGLFAAACSASTTTMMSLSEWIGALAINEVEFAKAIQLLRNYSLIEDIEGVGSYATHPVVHRWAYYFQGKDSRVQLAQLAVMVVGWAVPNSSSREYSTLQRRLLPHAQACYRWVLMDETRRSSKGHERVRTEIKVAEERVIILDAILLLGTLYHDQGKLAEAEQMFQRALQGYEKALGTEHTSTLDTVHNLGNLYRDQGKLAEAEQMYQRALQGCEKALGAEHTLTLQTVNNLGSLYCDQGKLAEAEQMFQRALQGKEKALGTEHTSTLKTVHNLGVLYADQGKLAEAEQMYQRALQGYEKAFGTDKTSTYVPALTTIWGLGSLYKRQGDPVKARMTLLKALVGYEKVLGSDHPRSRNLRDSLQALDTVINNEAIEDKEELANDSRGETVYLGTIKPPSNSNAISYSKSLA